MSYIEDITNEKAQLEIEVQTLREAIKKSQNLAEVSFFQFPILSLIQ